MKRKPVTSKDDEKEEEEGRTKKMEGKGRDKDVRVGNGRGAGGRRGGRMGRKEPKESEVRGVTEDGLSTSHKTT